MTTNIAGASPVDQPVRPGDLQAEALLHAGKCRTWAAKTFNDAPDAALCVGAGDRLLYAAQLLDLMALSEQGAQDAFGVVVQEKHDALAECKRLRELLDDCHAQIRRQAALLASRA
jgi:hypothetical protein